VKKLPAHDSLRGKTVKKYLVSLDPLTVERARILGFGNLSGGLREAVRRAKISASYRLTISPEEAKEILFSERSKK